MADTFDVWRGAANLGLFLLGIHLLEKDCRAWDPNP